MYFRIPLYLVPLSLLVGFAPKLQTPKSDVSPKVLEAKAPIYSPVALSAHASGKVEIEVEIDPSGAVVSTNRISGHPLLYFAARPAALGWRFESDPAHGSNRTVRLEFDFDIDASRCKPVTTITPYHLRIAPSPPPEVANYIRGDEEKYCEVHGTRLREDRVDIIYGLAVSKGYEQAEKTKFPHANAEILGDCLVETETCDGVERQLSPKYAKVLYCPKCRLAQQKWLQAHR